MSESASPSPRARDPPTATAAMPGSSASSPTISATIASIPGARARLTGCLRRAIRGEARDTRRRIAAPEVIGEPTPAMEVLRGGLLVARRRGPGPGGVGERALGEHADAPLGRLAHGAVLLGGEIAEVDRRLDTAEASGIDRPLERAARSGVGGCADLPALPGAGQGLHDLSASKHLDRAGVEMDDVDHVGPQLPEGEVDAFLDCRAGPVGAAGHPISDLGREDELRTPVREVPADPFLGEAIAAGGVDQGRPGVEGAVEQRPGFLLGEPGMTRRRGPVTKPRDVDSRLAERPARRGLRHLFPRGAREGEDLARLPVLEAHRVRREARAPFPPDALDGARLQRIAAIGERLDGSFETTLSPGRERRPAPGVELGRRERRVGETPSRLDRVDSRDENKPYGVALIRDPPEPAQKDGVSLVLARDPDLELFAPESGRPAERRRDERQVVAGTRSPKLSRQHPGELRDEILRGLLRGASFGSEQEQAAGRSQHGQQGTETTSFPSGIHDALLSLELYSLGACPSNAKNRNLGCTGTPRRVTIGR